jgi:hypothetical protein
MKEKIIQDLYFNNWIIFLYPTSSAPCPFAFAKANEATDRSLAEARGLVVFPFSLLPLRRCHGSEGYEQRVIKL